MGQLGGPFKSSNNRQSQEEDQAAPSGDLELPELLLGKGHLAHGYASLFFHPR